MVVLERNVVFRRTFGELRKATQRCEHQQAILQEVAIEHLLDEEPDTSYLEHVQTEDGRIVNSSRYDEFDVKKYGRETVQRWIDADRRRLDAFRDGEWYMIGIRAVATICVPCSLRPYLLFTFRIDTGGCWNIECDCEHEYKNEIAEGELMNLEHILRVLGVDVTELRDLGGEANEGADAG